MVSSAIATQDIALFVNGSAWKRSIPAGSFTHSGSDFVYEEAGSQPMRVVLYSTGLIHIEIHNFDTQSYVPYIRSGGMAFLVGGKLFSGIVPRGERKNNKLAQIDTSKTTLSVGERSSVSIEFLTDLKGEYEHGVDVYLDGHQIVTRHKTDRLFFAEAGVTHPGRGYWEAFPYMVDRKTKAELSRGIDRYSRENVRLRKLLAKDLTEARRAEIEAAIDRNVGMIDALNFQINQARIYLDGPVVLQINGEGNEVSQSPMRGVPIYPRSK